MVYPHEFWIGALIWVNMQPGLVEENVEAFFQKAIRTFVPTRMFYDFLLRESSIWKIRQYFVGKVGWVPATVTVDLLWTIKTSYIQANWNTLPETNIALDKLMVGRLLSVWKGMDRPIFRGYVSFRKCNIAPNPPKIPSVSQMAGPHSWGRREFLTSKKKEAFSLGIG